jgi:hypothetical protein
MAKPLNKATRGEPFKPSTSLQNATVDAIQYVRQLQASGGAGPGGTATWGTIVQVKNTSGADRDRFNVLGIDAVFPTPTNNLNAFKAGPVIEAITPATASHLSKFVILLAPAKDDAIVPAAIAGVAVVQIDILETTDPFCDVKDGDPTQLESNAVGGSTILWPNPPSSTGTQWCVVRIEGTGTPVEWDFELAATLVQWTDPIVPVAAYRRVWDPSANSGNGGGVTDCTQSMLVGDYKLSGFFGVAGANGWAVRRVSDNGVVWVIKGLNCPDECICGTDYTETAPCP